MKTSLLLILVATLSSCLGPDYKKKSAATPAASAPLEIDGLAGSVAATSSRASDDSGAALSSAEKGSSANQAETELFNDPEFRRHFAESYAAESDVEPRMTAAEQKAMLEVMNLVAADQLDEALLLIQQGDNPARSAAFDYTMGKIHYRQEDLDKAAESYANAVRKFRKFRRAWKDLAQVHFRRQDYTNAITAFTRVIELGGGDAVTYGLLGIANTKVENDIAAESAFRMASLMDPKRIDWKLGMAESFFRQQRFSDAVALFGGLIADHPERADLWLAQGEALARSGQSMKAAENFEMADRLGGSTTSSLNNLGDIYSTQELFDLAVSAYDRALKKDPNVNPDRTMRAIKYLTGQGATKEAKQLLASLEGAMGDRFDQGQRKELLKIKARIAVSEEATDEEVAILKEVVDLDPLDGDALLVLGMHASRSGDKEQASFYFERAAAIEAYEADARVRQAQLLVSDGRYAEALPLLQRAQSLKHRDNIQDFLEKVERIAAGR
jgi:tetratricopeptide (TPR) repeat protein